MIRIGCSGWQYKHWKGDFYPAGLREAAWLDWYGRSFDTVELNNSFYRLPEKHTFQGWHERSPPGFLFAVKASRYLTHLKKLKDPEEPLRRFFERAEGLASKLGPVLYQLPPRWPADTERLRAFVRCLPKQYRHAIEFRDPTWYAAAVLEVLESHDVALCLHDMHGSATGRQRLGPFVYVRFHGTTKYGGRYGDDDLGGWAEWIRAEHGAGRDVFAYFNNDVGGHAPRDAMRLRELVAA